MNLPRELVLWGGIGVLVIGGLLLAVAMVIAPFGLAVAWWAYADSTGLTQRRAIAKMEKRKADRRQRDMEALGLGIQRDKRARRAPASSASSASRSRSSRRRPSRLPRRRSRTAPMPSS